MSIHNSNQPNIIIISSKDMEARKRIYKISNKLHTITLRVDKKI